MRRALIAIVAMASLGACAGSSNASVEGDGPSSGGQGGVGVGSGGSAGAGGSGGQGGGPSRDLYLEGFPPEQEWLVDKSIWAPVAGTEEALAPRCAFREGDASKHEYPPLSWKSCGVGCEVADVVQGYGDRLGFLSLKTKGHPKGVGVRGLFYGWSKDDSDKHVVKALSVREVPSGTLSGMIQIQERIADGYGHCNFHLAPDAVEVADLSSPAGRARALWDDEERRWRWMDPIVTERDPGLCDRFFLDDGRMASNCNGFLGVASAPWSEEMELVFEGRFTNSAASEGTSLFWAALHREDEEPTSTLFRWSSDEATTKVVYDGLPGFACTLGASPTHVAGIAASPSEGTPAPCGWNAAPYFWSIRRDEGGEPVVSRSPVLWDAAAVYHKTVTWGDYIATIVHGTEEDERGIRRPTSTIWLARTTDWKVRRINANEGFEVSYHTIALDDTHLYFGEVVHDEWSWVRNLVRLDLSHFDELGTPLE